MEHPSSRGRSGGSASGDAGGRALRDRWREAELDRCRRQIERSRAAAENLSAQLRAALQTLHEARRQLAELEGEGGAGQPLEPASISALPDVADVRIDGDHLVVTTGPLSVEDQGSRHDLGRFEIELSQAHGIRIRSAGSPAGVTGAWIHPHVQAERPCLGNARIGLEKLLGLGEFAAVVDVLIRFLGSYDPETAYCPLSNWPVLPAGGVT